MLFCLIVINFQSNIYVNNEKNYLTSSENLIDSLGEDVIDNWPMLGHDSDHTGYSSSTAPDTNDRLFERTIEGAVLGGVSVFNDKVYVTTTDSHLYCINAFTGDIIFDKTYPGALLSAPAIDGEKCYFGSFDGNVYAVNALTGNTVWAFPTGSPIQGSPTLANGYIYIGGYNEKMMCIDIDGNEIWNFTTGAGVVSSPAVNNDRVYFGSDDTKFYCLNAINGSLLWEYSTGNILRFSPVVAYGNVYVGSGDTMYCFDAEYSGFGSSVVKWTFPTESRPSAAAVHDNKVYFGLDSPGKTFYCLNAENGQELWNYTADLYIKSTPAIADGKVYFGDSSYKVYCLDANTGEEIWKYTGVMSFVSGFAIYSGIVYAAVSTKLYAFGSLSNHPPDTPNQPIGPTEGEVNTEYNFSTTTTDPDGDQIYYWFDWGDNTNSGWISTSTANHSWTEAGDYQIKIKAKDIKENESEWSDPLTIHIVTNISEEPEEQQYGWIFGILSDDNTLPLEDASVCVSITDSASSKCKITDEKGRYDVSVLPGIYTVVTNKEGYETSTKFDIEVKEMHAIEVNFILQEIVGYEQEPSKNINEQFIEAKISVEIKNNKVGGKIEVPDNNVILYNDEVDIEISPTTKDEEIVTFRIEADEGTPGQVVVVRIQDHLNEIGVKVDGISINETADLNTFFSPDNQITEFIKIFTTNASYVLVHIANFSEHTITISSIIETIGGVTAVMLYIGFFAFAGVILLASVYTVLMSRTKSKKRK